MLFPQRLEPRENLHAHKGLLGEEAFKQRGQLAQNSENRSL